MNDVDERARVARRTNPFLTAKQAAHHLSLAYGTLKAMRAQNRGPRCRKHGRSWHYHVDDLEAWSLSQTRGGQRD